MKLTPRYDYYLNIDGAFHPILYSVWETDGKLFIKVKDTSPTLVASSEDDLYLKFEKTLQKSLMGYHLNGELWKFFPKYLPDFAAESARLVSYKHVPKWKKFINKLLRMWKR